MIFEKATVSISKYVYLTILTNKLKDEEDKIQKFNEEDRRYIESDTFADFIIDRLRGKWSFESDVREMFADIITKENADKHPSWKFWSKPAVIHEHELYSFDIENHPDCTRLFNESLEEKGCTRNDLLLKTSSERYALIYQLYGSSTISQVSTETVDTLKEMIKSVKNSSNDTIWTIPQDVYNKLLDIGERHGQDETTTS